MYWICLHWTVFYNPILKFKSVTWPILFRCAKKHRLIIYLSISLWAFQMIHLGMFYLCVLCCRSANSQFFTGFLKYLPKNMAPWKSQHPFPAILRRKKGEKKFLWPLFKKRKKEKSFLNLNKVFFALHKLETITFTIVSWNKKLNIIS